ncbi:9627_t:CDS:2 [Ambispora leptoticha]|uniref:9627_t:CDS:1 n=1 Tax=Ambispora leptoticha TaxID=144679 RepID=A0A9N9D7J3_9GLOM|nr:9627_t:CDS:2 [Ambispora leptoticha]
MENFNNRLVRAYVDVDILDNVPPFYIGRTCPVYNTPRHNNLRITGAQIFDSHDVDEQLTENEESEMNGIIDNKNKQHESVSKLGNVTIMANSLSTPDDVSEDLHRSQKIDILNVNRLINLLSERGVANDNFNKVLKWLSRADVTDLYALKQLLVLVHLGSANHWNLLRFVQAYRALKGLPDDRNGM